VTALVWYCRNRRCRRAIKVEPRYLKMTWRMCGVRSPDVAADANEGDVVNVVLAVALTFGTDPEPFRETIASWYGGSDGFVGNTTACGTTFEADSWIVASPRLPCGTVLELWHGEHGVIVTVGDRGPFADPQHRELDLAPLVRDALQCSDLCDLFYRVVH